MTSSATLTIPEAASLLGVSRNTAYEQAKTGAIAGVPVIRVGVRLVLPRAPFLAVLGLMRTGKDRTRGPVLSPTPHPRKVLTLDRNDANSLRYQLEALDRLEAARKIIDLLVSGHAALDPDTVHHLGHMLTAAAQRLAYAENFVGDDHGC